MDDVDAAKGTQSELGASAAGLYIGAGKNLEPGGFVSYCVYRIAYCE